VLLADASQNDTIYSFKRVFSPDSLNPVQFIDEMCSLSFSALGTPLIMPKKFNRVVSKTIPKETLNNQWLNIPSVYINSRDLGSSLVPILLLSTIPLLLESANMSPLPSESIDPTSVSDNTPLLAAYLQAMWDNSPIFYLLTKIQSDFISIQDDLMDLVTNILNFVSFFFLIRVSNVIGAERDDIMAYNIQSICKEYPNKDIVVVIGMLHCNGIAKWLMSGIDPNTAAMKTVDTASPTRDTSGKSSVSKGKEKSSKY
jgi:hypothetical protein